MLLSAISVAENNETLECANKVLYRRAMATVGINVEATASLVKVAADWESNFRERMEKMRTAAGMTQTELARVLREQYGLPFHQATIQRIEAGERPVRLNEAHLIAHAFQADLETMTAAHGTPAVVVSNLIAAAKAFIVHAEETRRFLADQTAGMDWAMRELYKAWEAYADTQQQAGLEVDPGLAELVMLASELQDSYTQALAAIRAVVESGSAENLYNVGAASAEPMERTVTAKDIKTMAEDALIVLMRSEPLELGAFNEEATTDGINH